MNIYKISQTVNNDYDTYDSAVVVASSPEEAQWIHPSEYYRYINGVLHFVYTDEVAPHRYERSSCWCHPSDVQVEYIGTTELPASTVICASFNAG